MEYKGIAVDLDYLKKLADEYDTEIKKLTEEIYIILVVRNLI